MDDVRQAERQATDATKQTARKTAEETSRAARTAAEAGAGVARAGADMFQRNTETARQSWESGTQMVSELVEQSMQQFARNFGRTFGIAGDNAQQATEQSARNAESIAQSGTIIAAGMQGVSRELCDFARKRMEQNVKMADAVMDCRTPQEFMAAQSNFVRDNLQDFVQSMRRIAEVSMQTADEATRRRS